MATAQVLAPLTAAANANANAGSNPEKLRQGFVMLAESLLKSVAEVFVECNECEEALELFGTFVRGNPRREDEFIRLCRGLFQTESEGLAARDPEAIFRVADGISVLKTLRLRSKWEDPEFNDASKEHFWQYLQALDTYAGLYCAVPPAVLGRIETMATVLGGQLQSGSLDLSRLDISQLGQQLMGSLSAEELQQFEGSSANIFASISKVASVLQRQTGTNFDVDDLMRRLGDLQGAEGGALDVASVVQQIGATIGPTLRPDLQSSVAALLSSQGGLGGGDLAQAQRLLQGLAGPPSPGLKRKTR
jgi:hypothetical protein